MGFWSSIGDGLKAAGSFVADHWQTIAVVAISTVVFAGVLVATGGTAALLAPTLGQLLVAGVASGAAGQLASDLFDHKTPGWDVVKAGAIGGVLTVATAGLGRFVPGLARPLENQIAQRVVVTAAGSAGGAGAQVMSNAMDGKPLGQDVLPAAVRGGATTLLASEGVRLAAPPIVRALGNTPPREMVLPPKDDEPVVTTGEGSPSGSAPTAQSRPPSQTDGIIGMLGGAGGREALLDELAANGVKFTRDNVVSVARDANGKIVFLENGTTSAQSARPAGLAHILEEHATDFANRGIPESQVGDFVMKAATEGEVVGYQGKGTGRPIYKVDWNGTDQYVAVTTGSNGYIVGANPTSPP